MNKKQKKVLIVYLIVLIIMLLFPPTYEKHGRGLAEQGYKFTWTIAISLVSSITTNVHIGLYIVQIILISMIFSILYILNQDKKLT